MIEDWNVLVTLRTREKDSQRRRETRIVAKHLMQLGDFQWTPFLGVLIGRVQDHEAFFQQLVLWEEDEPALWESLARVIPIDRTFELRVETFSDQLQTAILPYAERLDNGSFYVRVERRGHAGEIYSQTIEQAMDQFLIQQCKAKEQYPTVKFNDPDLIIVVETLENLCGVGSIPRALRVRYPFIRVP